MKKNDASSRAGDKGRVAFAALRCGASGVTLECAWSAGTSPSTGIPKTSEGGGVSALALCALPRGAVPRGRDAIGVLTAFWGADGEVDLARLDLDASEETGAARGGSATGPGGSRGSGGGAGLLPWARVPLARCVAGPAAGQRAFSFSCGSAQRGARRRGAESLIARTPARRVRRRRGRHRDAARGDVRDRGGGRGGAREGRGGAAAAAAAARASSVRRSRATRSAPASAARRVRARRRARRRSSRRCDDGAALLHRGRGRPSSRGSGLGRPIPGRSPPPPSIPIPDARSSRIARRHSGPSRRGGERLDRVGRGGAWFGSVAAAGGGPSVAPIDPTLAFADHRDRAAAAREGASAASRRRSPPPPAGSDARFEVARGGGGGFEDDDERVAAHRGGGVLRVTARGGARGRSRASSRASRSPSRGSRARRRAASTDLARTGRSKARRRVRGGGGGEATNRRGSFYPSVTSFAAAMRDDERADENEEPARSRSRSIRSRRGAASGRWRRWTSPRTSTRATARRCGATSPRCSGGVQRERGGGGGDSSSEPWPSDFERCFF